MLVETMCILDLKMRYVLSNGLERTNQFIFCISSQREMETIGQWCLPVGSLFHPPAALIP